MKKWKILTSSLLVASSTPLIGLVSCNEQTKYYDVTVLHDDGIKSTIETKTFGQDIVIKCAFVDSFWRIDQSDGKTTVKADNVETDWYVVGNNIIFIPYNDSWTTKTKIEVDIKTLALTYDVSVSHDAGVQSTTEIKMFGKDIVIKCLFSKTFWTIDQDDGKTTVKADNVETDWYVMDYNTIVIPHNDSWTTETKIKVDIKTTELTYNVEVQKDDYISDYSITKTFLNNIVINCSFNSPYLLNKNAISVKVGEDQQDYKSWVIDETGKQLTITKDDSWTPKTPIKISLVSDEIDEIVIDNLQTQYTGTVGEESSSEEITVFAHAKSSDVKYDVTSIALVSIQEEYEDIYYNSETHKICWNEFLNKNVYDVTVTANYGDLASKPYTFQLDIKARKAFLGTEYIPDDMWLEDGRGKGEMVADILYYDPDIARPQNISRDSKLTIKFSDENLSTQEATWKPNPITALDEIIITYDITLIYDPGPSPPYQPGYWLIDIKYIHNSTTLTLTKSVYCRPAI